MQDDVVALFTYDRWANTKVLDACRQLTALQYVADLGIGPAIVREQRHDIVLHEDLCLAGTRTL